MSKCTEANEYHLKNSQNVLRKPILPTPVSDPISRHIESKQKSKTKSTSSTKRTKNAKAHITNLSINIMTVVCLHYDHHSAFTISLIQTKPSPNLLSPQESSLISLKGKETQRPCSLRIASPFVNKKSPTRTVLFYTPPPTTHPPTNQSNTPFPTIPLPPK